MCFFDVKNKIIMSKVLNFPPPTVHNNYTKSPKNFHLRRYPWLLNKYNLQSCLSCLSSYVPNSRLQWQVDFDFVTFLLLQVIPSITLVCKRFELWIQTQNIVYTRFAVSKNRLRNTIQKSDWLWSCQSLPSNANINLSPYREPDNWAPVRSANYTVHVSQL